MPRLTLTFLALLLAPAAARAELPDAKGCRDLPLFPRMPGYYIARCEADDHATKAFPVNGDGGPTEQKVEGRYAFDAYYFDPSRGVPRPERAQLLQRQIDAAQQLGGQVLFRSADKATLKVVQGGTERWALVREFGGSILVTVVERKASPQEGVAAAAAALPAAGAALPAAAAGASPSALATELDHAGHAAVYGLAFEAGQAALQPQSAAALAEIAALLSARPQLRVRLVAHTEAAADVEASVKLSQARADATLAALTGQYGVDPGRLTAHGVGSLCPIAPNASEEDRAKNRRLELVAW